MIDFPEGAACRDPSEQTCPQIPQRGRAADLVRVEVLIPPSARDEVPAIASRMRAAHRWVKERQSLLDNALRLYGPRILDNVDLDRLPDVRSRAAAAARAMIDRGDARAFAMGRKMLDRVNEQENRDGS